VKQFKVRFRERDGTVTTAIGVATDHDAFLLRLCEEYGNIELLRLDELASFGKDTEKFGHV